MDFKSILFGLIWQIFLITMAIWLIASPLWIRTVYQSQYFNQDIFEQSKSERIQMAIKTLELFNKSNQTATLEFSKLGYNSREIKHLIDVKYLFLIHKSILVLSSIVLIFFSKRFFTKNQLTCAINKVSQFGGIVILIFAFLALLLWDISFNLFHQLLFKPGTWLFYETDLLIRLFPPIFWFFSAASLFGLIIVFQILSYLTTKKLID